MSTVLVSRPATVQDSFQSKQDTAVNTFEKPWEEVVQEFEGSLLDPCFLQRPIRGSTVNAALLYKNNENSVIHCMPGSHKHLGGAYDAKTGNIYGVPANSPCILCLEPASHDCDDDVDDGASYRPTTIPLPSGISGEKMKWLRGIVHDGYLWAIPSWASAVLCLHMATKKVELIALPPELSQQQGQNRWQWHGGGLNHDQTAIYCIPSNARQVLKIDILNKTTKLIPIDTSLVEQHYDRETLLSIPNKWYGGIVGVDGCIYGIPYRCHALLQIYDDENVRLLPVRSPESSSSSSLQLNQYNWHGGVCVNGKIYAHPSHANTVLVIDTNPQEEGTTPRIYELPIYDSIADCEFQDTSEATRTYKWLGGAVGVDGNVYCPACDTASVLKINVETEECTTYGDAGLSKNKWQGGLLSRRDGCVYCIPANGQHILRIGTTPANSGQIQLLGELPAHKDKWQGGSVGLDGSLYFIPENGYRVLKVTPPAQASDVLSADDVKVEFL